MSSDIQRLLAFWLKHDLCTHKQAFGRACDYLDLPHHVRQQMWSWLKEARAYRCSRCHAMTDVVERVHCRTCYREGP